MASDDPPKTRGGVVLATVDRVQQSNRPLSFVVAVVKKFSEDGGGRLAAVVASYAFFSVFPAILAFVAILGFVLEGRPGLRAGSERGQGVGLYPRSLFGDDLTDADRETLLRFQRAAARHAAVDQPNPQY